jgi:hypothetical protein
MCVVRDLLLMEYRRGNKVAMAFKVKCPGNTSGNTWTVQQE